MIAITLAIAGYIFGGLSFIIEKLPGEVAKLPGDKELVAFLVADLFRNYTLAKYALGVALAVAIYLILLIRLPQILDLNPKSGEKKNI